MRYCLLGDFLWRRVDVTITLQINIVNLKHKKTQDRKGREELLAGETQSHHCKKKKKKNGSPHRRLGTSRDHI